MKRKRSEASIMASTTVGTAGSGTDSSSNATLQNETREQSQRLLKSSLLQEEKAARAYEELTTNTPSDQKTTKKQSQEEYDLLSSFLCSSSINQDENDSTGTSRSARATPILMEKDDDDDDDDDDDVDLEDESSETKDHSTHRPEEDVNDGDATTRAAQQQHFEESLDDETNVQDRCALLRNASRWDSRLKIAEWCYKVIDHHHIGAAEIPRDTVYLAMKLFDQVMDYFYDEKHNYHHQEEDSRRFLQLTSLVCLYLGVKVYYFFSTPGSSNSKERSSTSLTKQSLKRSMAQGDAVVLEGDETAPSLVEQFSSQECPILSMSYLLRHCCSDPSIKMEHLRRMETFVTKQTLFREGGGGDSQMPMIFSSSTRMPLPTPGQFLKLILRSIDWSSSSTVLLLLPPTAAHDGVDYQDTLQQLKEDIYQHSLYLCELATCDHYFSSSYHHRSSSNKSESSNSSRNAIVLASDVALSAAIVSGDLHFRRRTTTNNSSSSSSFMLLLLKPLLEQSFSLTKTKKRHLRLVCQRLLELNDNSSSGILIERRHPQGYSAAASSTENPTLVENEHPPSENESMATNDSSTSFPHVISSCGAED